MGEYVDSLKLAGESFWLTPRPVLMDMLKQCHDHNVLVSTGEFLEHVLMQGTCCEQVHQGVPGVGFDIIEISCGFITIPAGDWLRLVEKVRKAGLKPKPKFGTQFGACGATRSEDLEAAGTRHQERPIVAARGFSPDTGAHLS